jgi:hypothetical protein
MKWSEPEPEHRLAWRVPCLPAYLPDTDTIRPTQDHADGEGVKYGSHSDSEKDRHIDTHKNKPNNATHIVVGNTLLTAERNKRRTEARRRQNRLILQEYAKFVRFRPRVSGTTARTEHRLVRSHAPSVATHLACVPSLSSRGT